MCMDLSEALAIVAANRQHRIVIPTMGAISVWPMLSDQALDFYYMPSSMGQGPALGLGLALAQPEKGVIVLCGDGSLLMNLGCLVTVAQHPANLWLILLDNGQYEITGGQPVPMSGRINYALLAQGAGLPRAYSFESHEVWKAEAPAVFAGQGPVFVWLKLTPRAGQKTPTPPRPMAEQIQRLQCALAINSPP